MAPRSTEAVVPPPAPDEPAQDVHRVGVLVGAQEGLWLFLALWIAHQHPADRHLPPGAIPKRRAPQGPAPPPRGQNKGAAPGTLGSGRSPRPSQPLMLTRRQDVAGSASR